MICHDDNSKEFCQNYCEKLAENVKEALKLGKENHTKITLVRNEDAILAPVALIWNMTRFLNIGLREYDNDDELTPVCEIRKN